MLPMQQASDLVCLPFAYDELQCVAQCDQPSLAAKGAHFADVIDVYEGVSMHSLELRLTEPLLNSAQ